MTRAAEYRHLANNVRVRAAREKSPMLRAEWENLAQSYLRLAEQTEATNQLDPVSDRFDPVYDLIAGDLHVNTKRTIQ